MGDCIANQQIRFTICPKCKNRTLQIRTWEEFFEGWGFNRYKIEDFAKCKCNTCHEVFDYGTALFIEKKTIEAEARHIKRTTHQKQRKRMIKRGKSRRAAIRWWKLRSKNKYLDEDKEDVPF